MTATNHALTGALIVLIIKEPTAVIPVALLSHFLLDAIPHWNHRIKFMKTSVNVLIDVCLAVLLLSILALIGSELWLIIMLGGFFAVSPDLMWLPYILSGKTSPMSGNSLLHRIRRFHAKIQWSETDKGLFIELAWFGLIIVLIGNLL